MDSSSPRVENLELFCSVLAVGYGMRDVSSTH
jgi:hypothetical protein